MLITKPSWLHLHKNWRHGHVIFKGTSIKSVANFFLCKWFVKETYKWGYDYTTRFSKGGGFENK
jgi:hypothetical protein